MNVSFYDFASLHNPSLLQEIAETLKVVIQENAFVEGSYNLKLETAFCEMLKSSYCRLVGNCTDALEIALKVHDIGPGDYVAVPGISFHASAECIVNVGATPVLVDVDPKTGLMDPEQLTAVAKEYPLKAVIPVHIYGLPAPMAAINEIAKKFQFAVIEDAAQAIGTQLPSGPVGSGDNLVCFSFYPTKNLGAFGDAGAILTNNEEWAKKVSIIRNHGRSSQGLLHFGRNSRCDHIQAAVLLMKLKDFPAQNEQRKVAAHKYTQNFKSLMSEGKVEVPGEDFIQTSSWHLYPILVPNKDIKLKLHQYLKDKQVQTMLFYEQALGDLLPMQSYPGKREESRRFAERVLCLPIHPFLKDEQIQYVTEQIRIFFTQL